MVLGSVSGVFAKAGGEGNNTNCNGVGNANSPCNPNTPVTTPTGNNTNGNSNSNDSLNISGSTSGAYAGSSATAISNSTSNSAALAGAAVNNSGNSSSLASGGSSESKNVNNNTVNQAGGGGTNINSIVNVPRQAPVAYSPNLSAQGNNSFSGGISTPFGGISLGSSSVDGSVRQLNRATADGILVDAMLKVQECNSDECIAFKKYLLRRFK